MKKMSAVVVFVVSLVWILSVNCALASGISPRADAIFTAARVSLSSAGKASFSAQVKSVRDEIKVSDCVLQVKKDGKWSDDTTLTPPSHIATSSRSFSASKDYSSNCSEGKTYRIKAIFDADGHTKTAYSNSVDY